MSASSTIFNVPEPTGAEQAQFETTAAEARLEAPTTKVAHQIEVNAEQAQEAAREAALAAQAHGSSLTGQTSNLDQLQQSAKETTNAAVAEGQQNVQAAKAGAAGYVDQAKALAANALATAQSYLPTTVGGNIDPSTVTTADVVHTLQGAAVATINTTKTVIGSAAAAAQPHIDNLSAAAQPHIDNAKATAQPHIDNLSAATQPHIDNAKATAQPHIDNLSAAAQPHIDTLSAAAQPHIQNAKASLGLSETAPAPVPATSAPLNLESGQIATTPYPATTTSIGTTGI